MSYECVKIELPLLGKYGRGNQARCPCPGRKAYKPLYLYFQMSILEFSSGLSRSSGFIQNGTFLEARSLGTHAPGVRTTAVVTNSFKLYNRVGYSHGTPCEDSVPTRCSAGDLFLGNFFCVTAIRVYPS